MIKLACPNPGCRRSINAGDGLAGRRVKCPACGGSIAVPDPNADDDEDTPRRKTRGHDDDAPRRRSRRDDDDYDSGPRRQAATGLLAAKGLSSLAAVLFFVGATFLVLLGVSTFFPWVTINMFGVSTSASGLNGWVGWMILILSLLIAIFAIVAFFVLNATVFKISLWSAFGWALVAAVLTLLNIINGPAVPTMQTGAPKMSMDGLGDMPADFGKMTPKMGDIKMKMGDLSAKMGDATGKMGDLASKMGDMGPKIGFGLWLAFVLGLLTSMDFGFLSLRSLFGGAGKRSRPDDD